MGTAYEKKENLQWGSDLEALVNIGISFRKLDSKLPFVDPEHLLG